MKIILIILFISFTTFAQVLSPSIIKKTKELRNKVTHTTGKDKLNAYLDLINYLSLNQPDKALLEKDRILQLAERLNDKSAIVKICLTLGESYSETHKNELSLEYFEKALNLSNELKDSFKIAESLIKMGRMKIPAGELDQSLNYFENALNISEKINDVHNKIFAINYLGILNYILNNIEEAEKLSLKGLELSKEHNFPEGIGLASEHLAIIRIKQENYRDALQYNNKAYEISRQKDFVANIPAVYYNYAVIYNRLGEYDKAIDYMNKSEKIRYSFGDIRGVASDVGMLGRIYLAKKDYNNAIDKFKLAMELYKEYNAIRPLVSVLNGLAIAYENIGDYKSAINYFKEFKSYSDSVYNENVKRQIAISNAQRQIEEKEKEITHLGEINRVQEKIQTYLIVFSSIILILFIPSIFLYLKVQKSKKILKETNNKLVLLNKERDKFFSIISHDLKSPFLGILGLTDLLKEEINSSSLERSKELLGKLDKALNNLYKLVENLLSWTIIQSGKMSYEPADFILTDVIDDSIEFLNSFSSQKNIRIKKYIEKDFIVYADRKMIFSVLMNLLSNAIKYSYPDSEISIIVSQKNDDFVSVQVKDNGVGISEENLSKIFHIDQNISTEGTQKEIGTGLGLLVVKEMVTKNNGEINITSNENLGSIFEFTLPLKRA